MKKIILGLLLATLSTAAFAGSYKFECTAYHLDKDSNEIFKLAMTREGASMSNYPGVMLDIEDPNIDLFSGAQTYVSTKKAITLKIVVKAKANIVSLYGNIGPRDQVVEMNSVSIAVDRNGDQENFEGSCTETTITSCGGPCNL
ncbi:MAG: hypothetical protein H7177_10280 [Rhizobacter sp.]|nr:hypothetical protein [Bacteriovorax sp.]